MDRVDEIVEKPLPPLIAKPASSPSNSGMFMAFEPTK